MTDSEFAPGEDARPPFAVAGVAATEAAELLEIVTSRAADFSRRAADDPYECLLLATQDYLIDNARFNIGERIASAERQARHDREAWGKAEARCAMLLDALRYYADQAIKDGGGVARVAIAKAEGRDQ